MSATSPQLSLIVAMDRGGVIGLDGGMPWHLPDDLRWFKQQTQHKPIVMGRRTYESIGRALPKRRNLVVTRDTDYTASGIHVVHSLAEASMQAADEPELMVIGGSQIYALALPRARRLLLTRIEADYAGDTWFPEVNWNQWRLCSDDPRAATDDQPAYRFMVYERTDD